MNDYFSGAVPQLVSRGEHLISVIPTSLSREFHFLEQKCRDELCQALDGLRSLLSDPLMNRDDNQAERLRKYRRLIEDLDFMETVCIVALERAKDGDKHLSRLVEKIRREVSYPLPPPTVTPFSQAYYQSFPRWNLICVPLSEGHFLLHLPDLYHELAHHLLAARYDPRVRPFQEALFSALDEVIEYIDDELEKEARRRGPDLYTFYLNQWSKNWISWIVEFFCDLFAVFTIGPAFAWSHLHLFATRGNDPYYVPVLERTIHPPDGARMETMLDGLCLVGFAQSAGEIERRWNELVLAGGAAPEPEYHRCFPRRILKNLGEKARDGLTAIGCRLVTPQTDDAVHSILNEAWEAFWSNPGTYAEDERALAARLQQCCSANLV